MSMTIWNLKEVYIMIWILLHGVRPRYAIAKLSSSPSPPVRIWGDSEPECGIAELCRLGCVKLGTGDHAIRPCMHSASFSWHNVLLLLARSRAVNTWRVDKLTVINKLKINYLMLLLSSTDGPLLRYMRVFRIMQNAQVKFVSGIFYVLIYL